MHSAILADNDAQLRRLEALVTRLGNSDRGLGDGWTVGIALAHLAFWDRRAVSLLNRWRQNGTPPDNHPDAVMLNDTLLDEWRMLGIRQSADLAVSAARAVNSEVEEVDAETAEAITSAGDEWLLHRARHRREHLDQIERVMAGERLG